LSDWIQCEATGLGFLKDALGYQVIEHLVQGSGITAGCGGQIIDVVGACGDLIRDSQRRHHVQTPGRAEIAQRV
jgi:hypothetical protein